MDSQRVRTQCLEQPTSSSARLTNNFNEQLKQLHVTLLNLKVVTTYAKELVETLAQKPNRIIFSGKPATLTPESEILKSSKPLPATKTVEPRRCATRYTRPSSSCKRRARRN